MRHTDRVYVKELGFTAEEVAFLKPQAEAMLAPFLKRAHKEVYAGDKKNFYDLVREKAVSEILRNDPIARVRIETINAIAKAEPKAEPKPLQETVLAEAGFALKHSAFGSMEVGNPSGLSNHTVGSPSLGNYHKSLTFKSASADVSEGSGPRLYGNGRDLMSLTLTLEQFCMMIRGNKGVFTPCGLEGTLHWADSVPKLTNAKVTERDIQAEIWKAELPLVHKIRAFSKLLEAGASKRGEYEALIQAAKEARAAFETVQETIMGIAMEAGHKEGQIAQKQFQSDMQERLGQLKLGSGFASMLRLLSQDDAPGKGEN